MIRLMTTGVALCLVAGCPVDSSIVDGGLADRNISTDRDGAWQITSETGLVNQCVTILGDRVTQVSQCDGAATLIADTEPSARSGDQIIWTFRDGDVQHTISVNIQSDGTLRGTYSLRTPESVLALTDRIIMERRQLRV